MKRYLKVYGITVLSSLLCIVFPWLLAHFGVFTEMDVLQLYGMLSAIVAMIISAFLLTRCVKEKKQRKLLILLNPAIYYIIALIVIGVMIASDNWSGFNLMW